MLTNVRGECAEALSELGNGLLRLALEISVLRSRVSGLAFKLRGLGVEILRLRFEASTLNCRV